MVTKQEQLEWLAKAWESWSPYERGYVMMSNLFLGDFCSRQGLFGPVVHEITREEWQKEQDKLTSKQITEQEVQRHEQHNFQEWCKEILPIVQAAACGEIIEARFRGEGLWVESQNDWECFGRSREYRIKPKTIKVNGFDVPEPIKGSLPSIYYMPCLSSVDLYSWADNIAGTVDNIRWQRGICHKTKEAAIAHARALLGIDPNKE